MKNCCAVLSALIILIPGLLIGVPANAQAPDWVYVEFDMEYMLTDYSGNETYGGVTIDWDIGDGYATATFTAEEGASAYNPDIALAWDPAPNPLKCRFSVDTNTGSEYAVTIQSWDPGFTNQYHNLTEDIDWGISIPGNELVYLYIGLHEYGEAHEVTFNLTWGDDIVRSENPTLDSIKALYR